MTAKHVAVSLQKGGVGKTMVSINVAGALNRRGHDVLFVDCDPQGNATEGLGFEERYLDPEPNLASVLVDDDDLNDVVEVHDEMDVIPSNIDLFGAESELVSTMRGRVQLKRAVDSLLETRDYDTVVYDCPPSLMVLTDSALLSAENILIPALAEETSKRALETMFDQIETLEQQYEQSISEVGLVANRVETDGESTRMMEWFSKTFRNAIPVFEVRKRVALKRAWGNAVSIFEHDEECDMEPVFDEIAQTVEEQI